VLRSSDAPVGAEELAPAWPEPQQRDRALASLVADGLVVRVPGAAGDVVDDRWALPG
jgi:A/G-specific adenine glycosylase